MGLTMRSGLVPFDQPISRVCNYYAEMMHSIQIIALNVCLFWGATSTLLFFFSVTMCTYYACYGVEIKKCCLLSLSFLKLCMTLTDPHDNQLDYSRPTKAQFAIGLLINGVG